MPTRMSPLAESLASLLPASITNWKIVDHPLFTIQDWHGIEVITPGVTLPADVREQMRERFDGGIPASAWALGYKLIRFADEDAAR